MVRIAASTWRIPIQSDVTRTASAFELALLDASDLVASDPAGALERITDLIAEMPDPRAFRVAGEALRSLGRVEEAAQAELSGIALGVTHSLKIARSAQQAGRSGEARSIAEEYLRTNPGDLLAMTIASEAAFRLGDLDQAEPMLRQVVDRAPGFPPANILLASVLADQLRLHEAAGVLERLLRRVPQETNAKRFLADIRSQMNDPAGAASLYEGILAGAPDNPAELLKYAHFLRSAGLPKESIEAIRRAISLSPADGTAWWALAHYFPEEITAQDKERISAALVSSNAQPRDLGFLQLAVSIVHDRQGDHHAAFEAITSAQELLSLDSGYDADLLTRHVDELVEAYTPKLFERLASKGSNSNSPIFIVGMPRSGSTLLERILGQHSKIEAAGELPLVPRLIATQQPGATVAYKSLLPASLVDEKLTELSEWYLERSQEYRRSDKPHFIDKYNGNWIRTGLIRLLFPKAKIIDIRRNPLDCCWAVFKRVLVGDYANDQRNVARHYVDYVRLMDAMTTASPDGILTVSYEELVGDVEGQTRRVLGFLGLDFESACLDYHLSRAAVTTASSEQVRRPINKEGIGSAEPYKPWLKPLISELEGAFGKEVMSRR